MHAVTEAFLRIQFTTVSLKNRAKMKGCQATLRYFSDNLRVWGTRRIWSSQDALPQTGFKALWPSVSLDKFIVNCWGYAEESELNSIATIFWYHEKSIAVVDLYILIPGVPPWCKLISLHLIPCQYSSLQISMSLFSMFHFPALHQLSWSVFRKHAILWHTSKWNVVDFCIDNSN